MTRLTNRGAWYLADGRHVTLKVDQLSGQLDKRCYEVRVDGRYIGHVIRHTAGKFYQINTGPDVKYHLRVEAAEALVQIDDDEARARDVDND